MSPHPHSTVKGLTLSIAGTTSRWLAWVWTAVTLILLTVGLSLGYFGVPMKLSLVDMAGTPARYWVLALGVGLALEWRYYLAAGVTRRVFTASGLLASLIACASMSLALALLYFVEYQIYDMQGWTAGFGNPNLFSAGSQAHLVLAQYMVLFGVHVSVGWLLGAAFQRFHAWALTLIPVAFVAVYATEGLMGSGWFGKITRDQLGIEPGVIAALVGGAVIIAAMCVGVVRTMRDIPMAPKTN